MDYGLILRQSWETTWKYKGLWLLGILAGCSGSSGGSSFSTSQPGNIVNYRMDGSEFERFFGRFDEGLLLALLVGFCCLMLLLILVSSVLQILGRAGLISGFDQADQGATVTLGSAFRGGTEHFWTLFILQLILLFVGLIIGGSLLAVITAGTILTLGLVWICLIPLFCLLIPFLILLGSYVMLTQVAIVVDRLSASEALARAWELVREHFGPVIIFTLVLSIGGGLITLIISSPILFVGLPMLVGLVSQVPEAIGTGMILSGLGLLLYLPLLILLNGVLQTFVVGVWTLAYRRLAHPVE